MKKLGNNLDLRFIFSYIYLYRNDSMDKRDNRTKLKFSGKIGIINPEKGLVHRYKIHNSPTKETYVWKYFQYMKVKNSIDQIFLDFSDYGR